MEDIEMVPSFKWNHNRKLSIFREKNKNLKGINWACKSLQKRVHLINDLFVQFMEEADYYQLEKTVDLLSTVHNIKQTIIRFITFLIILWNF